MKFIKDLYLAIKGWFTLPSMHRCQEQELSTAFYCISDEGELMNLGEHINVDEAYIGAMQMDINPIWVFDQEDADKWLERLKCFKGEPSDNCSKVQKPVLRSAAYH